MTDHTVHKRHAIALVAEHSAKGEGGPFGAVVVLNGAGIGEGWNPAGFDTWLGKADRVAY